MDHKLVFFALESEDSGVYINPAHIVDVVVDDDGGGSTVRTLTDYEYRVQGDAIHTLSGTMQVVR